MLVRDEAQGLVVYLTRRSGGSRFMPGAYVFPGGAVAPEDDDPALLGRLRGAEGTSPRAVVVAGLRELLEEAGILFARDAGGVSATLDESAAKILRAQLAAGIPLAALLAQRALMLDAAALVHYSNWITPPTQRVRFDTHFFVARAPADQEASADAAEVYDGTWLKPADALERAQHGKLSIIFPTRKHLERLARFDTVEPLLAHARERQIVPVRPLERGAGDVGLEGEDDDRW